MIGARRRARAGWWFVAPNLLAVLVFLAFPLAFSIYLSCHAWDLFHAPRFVGAAQFRRLFADPMFGVALRNTVIYTVVTVVGTTVIGLAVAAVLQAKVAGIGLFRGAVFLPLVASTAAMTVVWRTMFDTDTGVLNRLLGWIGIDPVPWLGDPVWAFTALCLVGVWRGVPFAAVVLLAALQAVPPVLHEAARIDGAGRWRRFRCVSLPLIRPALGFVVTISIINSFQAFDQAYVLTGGSGGPESGTYLLGIMMFQNAFVFDDPGYAAALTWVIVAVLLLVTALRLRAARSGAV
ncbi:carbohydrate ABC transporter permease [Nocardia stercoris]|uniref:Sugar ABC transporter permease n=1 Tax=Nocardia stercoris TaxID=2483361 RepID=A0A3M2L287_9NOCA|nr:sugar ABC transporter permease [Nocardia stercoris]RMI30643.1 sugar ABC transporter permease [Nocardia stercoris]